jgi:hypothetical protein
MTPKEHIAYWKKAAADADTKGAALTAFGVYAGLSMAEEDYKAVLKKLVFAARISGGVAGRDELLCSACDEAERLLQSSAVTLQERKTDV